jgi:predicted RNA-binding protein
MASESSHTWILTASPENHEATRAHGFSVIGIKERNRARALQIEPGDRIILYLTKVMCFAGAIKVTGEMYEDRAKIWPGKPGKADAYPWRFETEPELVLEQDDWLAAESLADELEHIKKWPREHWKLAFQGQLRTVSSADSRLLLERMGASAAARA